MSKNDVNGIEIKMGDNVRIIRFHNLDKFVHDSDKFEKMIFEVVKVGSNGSQYREFPWADLRLLGRNPMEFRKTLSYKGNYYKDRNIFKVSGAKFLIIENEESELPKGYVANSLVQRGV